jgi:DNA-binding CsgD family transcriptional regulator
MDAGECSGLTPREREAVALVAEGLSNRAVAARMGCAEQTTKNHLDTVYAKLGLPANDGEHNPRVLAVVLWLREGES